MVMIFEETLSRTSLDLYIVPSLARIFKHSLALDIETSLSNTHYSLFTIQFPSLKPCDPSGIIVSKYTKQTHETYNSPEPN
jgi:hypothetical protein